MPYSVNDEGIRNIIAEYEKQFGMKSEEFQKQFKEGTIEETFETNFWKTLLNEVKLRKMQSPFNVSVTF